MAHRAFLTIVALLLIWPSIAHAAESCGLTSSFLQDDIETVTDPVTKKTVKKTFKRKVLFDDNVFVFSEKMKVNTDGAVRSYSPKDLDGMKCKPVNGVEFTEAQAVANGCAMNSICNGANVHLPNGTVLDSGSCGTMLPKIRAIQANNWKSVGGAKIEWIGVEPKDPKKKIGGEPCIDPANGFFVSTASTPSGIPGEVCEQKRQLDALVPSIVVPKCWSRGFYEKHTEHCQAILPQGINPKLSPGDLVAVRTRDATPRTFFAVIGDTGPNRKLGEASVGLLMDTHGKPAPRWLRESYALSERVQFDVVIFRGTPYSKPLTTGNADEMKAAARDRFKTWGSGDPAKASERLAACGQAVAP